MRDDRDIAARLTVLRRLLSLVTDPAAIEAIRQNIAQLEALPQAPAAVEAESAPAVASR